MNASKMPKFTLIRSFNEGAEARIITGIGRGLLDEGLSVQLLNGQGRIFRISLFKAIAGGDALIVHSPLAYSLFYVLFARLIGVPVVSLIWDRYPVTLDGRRFNSSLRRRFLDWAENLVIFLSARVLAPSRDFLVGPGTSRAQVVPFWFPVECRFQQLPATQNSGLRVIFAGQINATRDLEAAFAELEDHFGVEFILCVASHDPLPAALIGKLNVEYLGHLGREELEQEMVKCSFGLVTLAEALDGPGLPSKTWDYLGAGLPILYIGKILPHYAEALTSSGVGFVLKQSTHKKISAKTLSQVRLTEAGVRQFSKQFELDSEYLAQQLTSIISE